MTKEMSNDQNRMTNIFPIAGFCRSVYFQLADMNQIFKHLQNLSLWAIVVFVVSTSGKLYAQDEPSGNPLRQGEAAAPKLASEESRLGERYDRLELLAGRLAELSRSTQPRRARLLRELVSKSREQDIAGRFDLIVKALEEDRLASASEDQGKLRSDLQKLLDLLLQEGRDRQLESERKRIAKYLAELKKLIRLQRGIKARTDGGDDPESLGKDQQRVAKATGKLRDQIDETEGPAKPSPGESKDAESPEGEGKPAQENSDEPKPDTKPTEGEQGKPRQGESKESKDGKPGESKPNEGKPSDGKPGESKPSDGKPSDGQPSEGQSSSGESESQESEQTPAERATKRLKQAQQRMQQAMEQLEEAKRNEAVEKQEQALRELEQAKAELERILRQLREEELERTLVLLEARFRKMLDAQMEVYEQTQKLDASQANVQTHELEIAAGRLSRKEGQIVRDADRALVLLREDGTSVAFPEALEQAREDMQVVAERLADVKLGLITQGLEEDIVATLEEILAALQKAIKELREQQSQQQQQGQSEPAEQALVDQLAELRMIRVLQNRINSRTKRYDEMIEGEQALEAELLEALDRLALRQERVYQATHDLDTGRNQ